MPQNLLLSQSDKLERFLHSDPSLMFTFKNEAYPMRLTFTAALLHTYIRQGRKGSKVTNTLAY